MDEAGERGHSEEDCVVPAEAGTDHHNRMGLTGFRQRGKGLDGGGTAFPTDKAGALEAVLRKDFTKKEHRIDKVQSKTIKTLRKKKKQEKVFGHQALAKLLTRR